MSSSSFQSPQIQNNMVYSLPDLYISGMNISVYSTTVLAIAPGQCRDQYDVLDMPISYPNYFGNIIPSLLYQGYKQPVLINSAVNGVNGLDQGSLAASTQYAIWVIGDSRQNNPVAGLLSLTSNAYPLIPAGYDSMRLLGFIETDASSHFVFATHAPQLMKNATAYYLAASSVLSSGNATSFTAVDLSTPIPSTTLPNVIAYLLVTFTPAAAGDYYQIRPTGSSATSNLITISGQTAGIAQTQYLQVIAGLGSSIPEIDYLVSSSSDALSISVVGWAGAPHTSYPT